MAKKKRKPEKPINGALQALNEAGPKPVITDNGQRDYPGAVALRQPKVYAWKPEENITAYELARAMEVIFAGLLRGDCDVAFERLPDEAKRHFEVTEQ